MGNTGDDGGAFAAVYRMADKFYFGRGNVSDDSGGVIAGAVVHNDNFEKMGLL